MPFAFLRRLVGQLGPSDFHLWDGSIRHVRSWSNTAKKRHSAVPRKDMPFGGVNDVPLNFVS